GPGGGRGALRLLQPSRRLGALAREHVEMALVVLSQPGLRLAGLLLPLAELRVPAVELRLHALHELVASHDVSASCVRSRCPPAIIARTLQNLAVLLLHALLAALLL